MKLSSSRRKGVMPLQSFKYMEPKALKDACALLKRYEGAKALAGGTALIYQIKRRLISPSHIVNLKSVAGLDYIEYDARKGLRMGALTRLRSIEKSPLVKEKYPWLADCVSKMGSVQMRNTATVGGNLCHGEPAADLPPLLMTLDARVRLIGVSGERTIRLENFYRDFYETALRKGEILCEVQVPRVPDGTGSTYLKYNPRSAMDMGVVGVAATIRLGERDSVCQDARIALGGVAPTVIRARKAEDLLKGKRLTPRLMERAAKAASAATDPLSDFRASAEYRKEMAAVYTMEAIARAAADAK